MNKLQETENTYLAELKSLFQDKFFMMLLGVSVAIVLLSTVYSAVKPKEAPITAKGDVAETGLSVKDDSSTDGLAGLDDSEYDIEAIVAQTTVTPSLAQGKQAPKQTVKPSKSEYVVKAGDNLWIIAEATYGSGYNFVDIASANKLVDANTIDIGQKLILPGVEKKTPTVGDITPQASSVKREDQAAKTHKIVDGDSLWDISVRYFGSGYEWSRIAAENKIPYPDLIYPNQVIRLRN